MKQLEPRCDLPNPSEVTVSLLDQILVLVDYGDAYLKECLPSGRLIGASVARNGSSTKFGHNDLPIITSQPALPRPSASTLD